MNKQIDLLKGSWYGVKLGRDINTIDKPAQLQEITLSEFIELLNPWKPKRGEYVMVSDSGTHWNERPRIYICDIEGALKPFLTVAHADEGKFKNGDKFQTSPWAYIRQIPVKPIVALTINGVPTDIKTLSDSELLALKNS